MFCNPPIKHYIFLFIRVPLLYNEQGDFFMFLINSVQEMVDTGAQQLLTWVTQLLPKVFHIGELCGVIGIQLTDKTVIYYPINYFDANGKGERAVEG